MTSKVKGLIKMLVLGVIAIVAGVLIINHTDSFLKIIMIAAGIGSIISGSYTLIGVSKWKYTALTRRLALIKGFESLAVGVGAVFIALFAAETALTVMVYIFAFGLLFSACVSFENAAVAKNFDIADMKSQFIVEGIISLLVAILLFFKPVETLVKVVQVLAILFIAIGAIMSIVAIVAMIKRPKAEKIIVEEAEIVNKDK